MQVYYYDTSVRLKGMFCYLLLQPSMKLDNLVARSYQPLGDRRHVILFERAFRQWRAFDAFARIALFLGAEALLSALQLYSTGCAHGRGLSGVSAEPSLRWCH